MRPVRRDWPERRHPEASSRRKFVTPWAGLCTPHACVYPSPGAFVRLFWPAGSCPARPKNQEAA